MLVLQSPEIEQPLSAAKEKRWSGSIIGFAHRRPFLAFFLLVVLSNVSGSLFNIAYNNTLIADSHLNLSQKDAFWNKLVPAYNLVGYSYCLIALVVLVRPLVICWQGLQTGRSIPPAEIEICRRRLVNLPAYLVYLNLLGWLPGAVIFPLGICLLGGWNNAIYIWLQFMVSIGVSALLTTTQTFFATEAFLIRILYPDFFHNARPAEVFGAIQISFPVRLILFWLTVTAAPLAALLAVALNFTPGRLNQFQSLYWLAIDVALVGAAFSGWIAAMVGGGLLRWMNIHAGATEQIALGNYDVRIEEQRPDEWGLLDDRFNDMVAELSRGKHMADTFGQFVSPHVRDEILQRYPGLEGEVIEITVLFADIRSFSQRSEGQPPDRTVELLNRFLTLAVVAVEEKGGWVNKFLGDGVLALFGAPRPHPRHADQAVQAALELMNRLRSLNDELTTEGQTPLCIGIGIHTGNALVGCIGSSVTGPSGQTRVRREFTAIGATVNLGQRVEQLTKSLGHPILLTEQTRSRLQGTVALKELGKVSVPGFKEPATIFSAEMPPEPDHCF